MRDDDAEPGSEGYDRLEFLSVLVEHYEDENYPMGAVTPRKAVAFMLEGAYSGIPADVLLGLDG